MTHASAKLAYASSSDETWMPKSGLCSTGDRGLDARIERRDHLQRHQQRQDEHAHRPLVGRHLGVEVGERQQPHERRDRRRRAGERDVPVFHRLHADDEGVGERGEHEQCRRRASDGRLAPGEVPDVGHERDGVEGEGTAFIVFEPDREAGEVRQRARACPACPARQPFQPSLVRRRAKYPCLVRAVSGWPFTRTTMRRQAPSRRGLRDV